MTFWRGFSFVSVGTLLLSPLAVFATALDNAIVPCDGVHCSVCDLAQLAQNLLNVGIYIAIFLSAVMFAYAGWEALTSAGNAEKYGHAKQIFTNVVIGLVIILAGWLVIDTLMRTMTGSPIGPWNQICELFVQHASAFV